MSKVDQFAEAAREFVEWCRARPADPSSEARTALTLIARLYLQALVLQHPVGIDYDLEGARPDDADWQQVYKRGGALPFNYYSSVFDPHVVPCDEPVVGDLANDVADIYRDLSEGLSLYKQGHVAEAEWEFWNSFRTHWGRHAASAIHALHCWIAEGSE